MLSIFVSAFCCSVVLGILAMGTIKWWRANCLVDGDAGFACHSAAFYNAWWWMAILVAIPGVAVLLFMGSGRHRL